MAVQHVKRSSGELGSMVENRTKANKKKALDKRCLMNDSWKLLEEIARNPTIKKNSDSAKEQRKSYQILTFKNCTNF